MVVVVKGSLPQGPMTGVVTYFVIDQGKNAIVGQVILPDASDPPTLVEIRVQVPASAGPYAVGTFEGASFTPAATLSVSSDLRGPMGA